MKRILYVTDLYFKAKGRQYHEEDIFITSFLKQNFNVLLVHPTQAIAFLDVADLLIFRNTGPIMDYKKEYYNLMEAVQLKNSKTFNSFDGKADMQGKDYLIQLTKLDFPVIPTVEQLNEINTLGITDQYMIKIKDGADSIGMEVVNFEQLKKIDLSNKIIQPFIDFEHEISFYYINNQFQYALYAPDKTKRWELQEIDVNTSDIQFANQFIQWNDMQQGITRVDACRLKDGSLLLVELEDLNPFLSIQRASEKTQKLFLNNFITTINAII